MTTTLANPPHTMQPGEVSYQDRVITWPDGTTETGREAEVRISKVNRRIAWRSLATRLFKAAKAERRPLSFNEAEFVALEKFPPGLEGLVALEDVKPQDEDFIMACREGLLIDLPDRAEIDAELSWIAANCKLDKPCVEKAPSKSAISWAMDVRTDDRVRASFWSTYQAKRMSPGEKKPKKSAFKEDDAAETDKEAEVHQEELMKRLFGGGE